VQVERMEGFKSWAWTCQAPWKDPQHQGEEGSGQNGGCSGPPIAARYPPTVSDKRVIRRGSEGRKSAPGPLH
jgi:hypothetical protein